MRLSHSAILARMLLMYFGRRIFKVGALRSSSARLLSVTSVLLLIVAFIGAAYVFLESLSMTETSWDILLATSTITVVLWVQAIFLLIKTLFLNGQGVLALSFQMPLTNRERATSFLLCESVMAFALTSIMSSGIIGASILIRGVGVIPRLLISVMLPAVLTYLIISVLYQILARAVSALGAKRLEGPLLIMAMFALLLMYVTQVGSLTSDVADAYLNDPDRLVWPCILEWTSVNLGFGVTAVLFMIAAGVLSALVLGLMPNQHVRTAQYLNVNAGLFHNLLGSYDLALIRSSQTWLASVIAAAAFIGLSMRPPVNPLWGLMVLSIGGFYHYAATLPLRMMVGGAHSPWRVYGLLVRAQLVVYTLFLIPALAVNALLDIDLLYGSYIPISGYFGSVAVALWVGVAFPSDRDNPFSILVGLVVSVAAISVVALSITFLNLPPALSIACAILIALALVWYAVELIRKHEEERRYEKIDIGG